MATTLHQVYLMTPDLESSRQFCEDALGLTPIEEGARSVEYDTGACALKLEADFTEETLAGFGLNPPGEARGEGVIIVVEVDDVEAIHDQAASAGADVLMEPREVSWGREMCLIRSPSGYVFEVSRPV